VVVFKLQIVHPDGTPITFPAGGVFERDLIAAVTDAVVRRGVGVFRTEAHVRAAVADGMQEVLVGLKRQTRGLL
jgi:hypothetical protein